MDLPDEVDTPTTIAAKVRFQKYRGVRSLRTSSWDPYEELPLEFSRIIEFDNPEATFREGLSRFSEAAKSTQGKYCILYLTGGQWKGSTQPLVLSSLLEFETKVTLMHCKVQRLAEVAGENVNSKDKVTIQCGFRRYETTPIFSEAIKSRGSDDKITKFYRKLPQYDTKTVITASFYAPTIFGSAPSLIFDADQRLCMWGAVSSCQPSKPVVLKRVLLTGYPVKAHKRSAVVRYMFFNPSDILWYKPVELLTKKGLRGNIIEPLGTKGHMKCRFSAILTHDDIVCLPLYKRVYPPWFCQTWGDEPAAVEEIGRAHV
jgi:pre-rRNA-processing protein TSR1